MPSATGPLLIRVVYPPRDAVISIAGDSTFIFGSVGNGSATLTINSRKERFTGEFSKAANPLLTREYRKPFVVPKLA